MQISKITYILVNGKVVGTISGGANIIGFKPNGQGGAQPVYDYNVKLTSGGTVSLNQIMGQDTANPFRTDSTLSM